MKKLTAVTASEKMIQAIAEGNQDKATKIGNDYTTNNGTLCCCGRAWSNRMTRLFNQGWKFLGIDWIRS